MDRKLVQKAAALELELTNAEAMVKLLTERGYTHREGLKERTVQFHWDDVTLELHRVDALNLLTPHLERLRKRLEDLGVKP